MGDLASLPTIADGVNYDAADFAQFFADLEIAPLAVTTNKIADLAVTTAKVADKAVTLGKMADVATDTLLGRSTAGTGTPETIACTAAGRTLLAALNAAAQRTALDVPGLSTANTFSQEQTFSGGLAAATRFNRQNPTGPEGGQLSIEKSASSTLPGDIQVDNYNDLYRIFENGGSGRGAYIDITQAAAACGSKLMLHDRNLADVASAATARTNLGLGTCATESTMPVAKGGTGATDAATARTNLGLGSAATESTVPIAKGGTGATDAATARTNLGLGDAATNTISFLHSAASVVTQTGTGTGTALVFNTPGAPTITLTAGKWLVIGTVTARMSDNAGEALFELYNATAGAIITGAGASKMLPTTRDNATVIGYADIASGNTAALYFRATPVAGSTIDLGSAQAGVNAGIILAVRLTTP